MIEKILRRIWNDVRQGQNIDLYLTVFAAFGLVALNLLGIKTTDQISSITLAVLGLLAISMLGSRYRLEEIAGSLENEQSLLKPRTEFLSFEERGQNVSEIVIVGISLIIIYSHLSFFEKKLQQGCKLRFLLLDPDSQAVNTFMLMAPRKGVLRDIANTFDVFEHLRQREASTSGKVEARLSSVFLPYGIAAFDPSKKSGHMTVEPLVYKTGLDSRPHFILTKARSEHWFEFYQKQYELLWADSREWEPGAKVRGSL